jgi:aerobic carbon-monoxide dehydrogenase medium subunit
MAAACERGDSLLVPASAEEAIAAFGDGAGVTVLAGGTILMPQITYGRLRPESVLALGAAGLDGVAGDGSLTIGAMRSVQRVAEEAPEPLSSAAGAVADLEIRGQATLGGNLCAPGDGEAPVGDLQAPLIALGARVVSAGAGGSRTEPVEDFLAGPGGRLVTHVVLEPAKRAGYVVQRRRHAHTYAVLSVACAETAEGVRVAVGAAGPHAVRCPAVETALAAGEASAAAAARVLDDVAPRDDALASAWYRRRVLPTLVARALTELEGSR